MQQESRNSGASSSLSASSPSFTSYSSENIADIAARVVHELNLSREDDYDDDFYSSIHQTDAAEPDDGVDDDAESEFEFAVLRGEDTSSPISADEIFYNGQIKPSYPLFNTDLLYTDKYDVVTEQPPKTKSFRAPLRNLMMIERGNDSVSSSSSSSENAELEGVPPESYCMWAPKKNVEDDGDTATMKKKSKSTGTGAGSTSKRWRFRDLLHRSNSDGKDSFVFLHQEKREKISAVNGKYSNGKKTEETKKKSYLPYRQDLVGIFSNVNGISRTISPF